MPRPQRGVGEAVAVTRKVDALQPDDEHELQAASADARQQRREIAGREGTDLEQIQVEHRLLDSSLDEAEEDQHDHAAADLRDHLGTRPTHRVVAVGLDAVGDADHDRDQPDREGGVAPPVDLRRLALGKVGEHATEDQADRGARDRGHPVDAQGHAALVGGKGVGDDRAGVGEQHRAADALQRPHDDQPQRSAAAFHPGDREQDAEHREDREPEVVGLRAAVDVAQPAQADHEHRGDHQEAEDQPQQIVGVAREQGVDVDALEDVGQRDQEDRGVDGRDQDAQRRVGQGDPLVVVGDRAPVVVQALTVRSIRRRDRGPVDGGSVATGSVALRSADTHRASRLAKH
jgi:hypothetical protein